MASRDYYEVLGVPRNASADDIRKAYRKLVRQHHPDVNKAKDAAEKFKEVQEAYDALSDEAKRRQYDQFGRVTEGAGQPGRGPGGKPHYTWSNVGGGPGRPGAEMDMDDLGSMFDAFFGQGGGMRENPFGGPRGGKRPRAGRRPSPDEGAAAEGVTHDLDVEFMTAARGGTRQIRLQSDGRTRTIDVTIPRGVRDGSRLRVKGGAAPEPNADDPRDLILTVKIAPHPLFRRADPDRDGGSHLDLVLSLPLTIAEATLGATVTVPTLDAPVDLTIPPGTASGMKLRLKGKGIDDGTNKGDLYAVVKIVPPDGRELGESDREALTRISSRGPGPRSGPEWSATRAGR
ncbi:MAG: DnaJ C-terminal domain-containing protein [Phycisphaerales bacterium]